MTRWSLALALLVTGAASIAGEPNASACPTVVQAAPARSAGPVHNARHSRNARVLHRAPARVPALPAAPAPSAAPSPRESPASTAPHSEGYNLARINAFRAAAGVAPVTLDGNLSAFARAGSVQLMNDHVPHGHFRAAGGSIFRQGFSGGAAENQGSPTGWPRASTDPVQNRQRQIDQILASMMGEGPGGGHHRNMMNPKAKRVGIGLVEDAGGKLYLTNDFSE